MVLHLTRGIHTTMVVLISENALAAFIAVVAIAQPIQFSKTPPQASRRSTRKKVHGMRHRLFPHLARKLFPHPMLRLSHLDAASIWSSTFGPDTV